MIQLKSILNVKLYQHIRGNSMLHAPHIDGNETLAWKWNEYMH